MRRLTATKNVVIAVLAGVVGALAVGAALGAIGGGGVINACYKKSDGTLRVIDPATSSCSSKEGQLSWNMQGPKGDKGDPGNLALAGESCPARQVVTGFDSNGDIVCADTQGTIVLFDEDFKNTTPPAFPSGWSVNDLSPQCAQAGFPSWQTEASDAPDNLAVIDTRWCLGQPPSDARSELTSPSIHLPSGANELRFTNDFNFDSNLLDGGWLEISIDGSAFEDIQDAGGAFTEGGYNGQVDLLGPADHPGWVRSSADPCDLLGLSPVHVALPSGADGSDIQLRWVFATYPPQQASMACGGANPKWFIAEGVRITNTR